MKLQWRPSQLPPRQAFSGFFSEYPSLILYNKSMGKWDLLHTMYFTSSSLAHIYSIKVKDGCPPSDPNFKRDVGQTP